MAYAAGDRSVIPSTAPEEEVAPPPRPTDDIPDGLFGEVQAASGAGVNELDLLTDGAAFQPFAARANGAVPSGFRPTAAPTMLNTLLAVQFSTRIRTFIMVASAFILAVVIAVSAPTARRLSAVHLFLQMQAMFHIPLLCRVASMVGRTRQGLDVSGMLSIVSLIASTALGMKMVYDDAIVFAFTFLVSLRTASWAVDFGLPS
jgi:hypothetical protein